MPSTGVLKSGSVEIPMPRRKRVGKAVVSSRVNDPVPRVKSEHPEDSELQRTLAFPSERLRGEASDQPSRPILDSGSSIINTWMNSLRATSAEDPVRAKEALLQSKLVSQT